MQRKAPQSDALVYLHGLRDRELEMTIVVDRHNAPFPELRKRYVSSDKARKETDDLPANLETAH